MHVAFVHRRGAGQFRHLAAHIARRGDRVTVICETPDIPIPAVRTLAHAAMPPLASTTDAALDRLAVAGRYVQHGWRVAETLERLRARGQAPDVVVGHIGWGGMMFVKDVLPATPALGYCEYFFTPRGGDLGFDPGEKVTANDLARLRARNMIQQATLQDIDAGFSPTAWQRSRYPAAFQSRIDVCHEGVDIVACRPDPNAKFKLPDGRTIQAGDPVVTYVARSLEPYRGFPQFMRAAAEVARRRKDAIFVVAGDDTVSYGRLPPNGRSWRQAMLAETGIHHSRVVFLGGIAHSALVRLFQVSAAHVYLTVPFVLSWSMLEAMACGCLIVGSRTAPVAEVIADGRNGILTDFFQTGELVDHLIAALDKPDAHRPLRQRARATIEDRYRRSDCLGRQLALIDGARPRARKHAIEADGLPASL